MPHLPTSSKCTCSLLSWRLLLAKLASCSSSFSLRLWLLGSIIFLLFWLLFSKDSALWSLSEILLANKICSYFLWRASSSSKFLLPWMILSPTFLLWKVSKWERSWKTSIMNSCELKNYHCTTLLFLCGTQKFLFWVGLCSPNHLTVKALLTHGPKLQ